MADEFISPEIDVVKLLLIDVKLASVEILETVFYKDSIAAESIMKDVHEKGKGVVGLYPYDLAYTKVLLVEQRAEEEGFPLKITMEVE